MGGLSSLRRLEAYALFCVRYPHPQSLPSGKGLALALAGSKSGVSHLRNLSKTIFVWTPRCGSHTRHLRFAPCPGKRLPPPIVIGVPLFYTRYASTGSAAGKAQKPLAILSAMDWIRRSRASMLAQATCGVRLRRSGCLVRRRGWSAGIGSVE